MVIPVRGHRCSMVRRGMSSTHCDARSPTPFVRSLALAFIITPFPHSAVHCCVYQIFPFCLPLLTYNKATSPSSRD